MKIGGREFEIGKKVYIMGIINMTPDSFSDGGMYNQVNYAVERAGKLILEGADLIDVGGESTRPGYTRITEKEEISRVVPVIRAIKEKYEVPVSIDTYKSGVAREALDAGADMINDIWGFQQDEDMAALAAERDVPVCLMHNREHSDYKDMIPDMIRDLNICLETAKRNGVRAENIILDPGIGFGKTFEQNLLVMKHLDDICGLGYPVLLGTSRKSMIGYALDLPVEEREEGTIATSVIGAMKGCSFVRVHDVRGNARALRMAEAVLQAGI